MLRRLSAIDPAVHSDIALVAAAVETMSPFCDSDASLATGAPLLAAAEPALFLLAFAFEAFGRTIGNADALYAFCGVRRHQTRRASEQCLMCLDRDDQQVVRGEAFACPTTRLVASSNAP